MKGVRTEHDLAYQREEIRRMVAMNDEEYRSRYGHCTGTRREVLARYRAAYKKAVKERKDAVARAAKARRLFDTLEGAAKFTDAKLDWDDSTF